MDVHGFEYRKMDCHERRMGTGTPVPFTSCSCLILWLVRIRGGHSRSLGKCLHGELTKFCPWSDIWPWATRSRLRLVRLFYHKLRYVDWSFYSSSSQDDLILLTSFAGKEDQYGMDTRPRRFYAVVRMARGEENFEVKNVRIVPYQTVRQCR